MALTFFIPIVFTVSSFEFHKVKLPWLHCQCSGVILESYYTLQPKPKTVPEFKDALKLIWSALPEKAIDSIVKDLRKRLQAYVSQRWLFWKYSL